MRLTRSVLNRMVNAEVRSALKESRRPRLVDLIFEADETTDKKDAAPSGGKFKPLDATTNIKGVDPEDVYNQLVSKDSSAPVFKAMADAKGEWISPNWSVFERGGATRMVSPGLSVASWAAVGSQTGTPAMM